MKIKIIMPLSLQCERVLIVNINITKQPQVKKYLNNFMFFGVGYKPVVNPLDIQILAFLNLLKE